MNPEEVADIKSRLEALETWKSARERQQLTYPLDMESKDILGRDFLQFLSEVRYEAGAGGNPFSFLLGNLAGNIVELNPPSNILFSVDPTSNYIYTAGWDKFFNGETVNFFTSTGGTLPAPLSSSGNYLVSASSMKSFQVVSGGSVVNITDQGAGTHFVYKV